MLDPRQRFYQWMNRDTTYAYERVTETIVDAMKRKWSKQSFTDVHLCLGDVDRTVLSFAEFTAVVKRRIRCRKGSEIRRVKVGTVGLSRATKARSSISQTSRERCCMGVSRKKRDRSKGRGIVGICLEYPNPGNL